MTQNIPLSDAFTENGGYGAFLANYLRVVPWNSTTFPSIGPYTVVTGEGTLNSGYKASFGGVAMTSTSSPTVADAFCATVWRQLYTTDETSEAAFKLATTAGLATDDSFRACGVCVRAQAGTFDNTWQHERNIDHTAYWFVIVGTLAAGCQFRGIRVVAGVPASMGAITPSTLGLPNNALALIPALGRKLSISVVNNVFGDPVLTFKTANADGSNEITVATITDPGVSKIATPGRAGFGMVRDRVESGTNRTATLCTYFRALDGATEHLRDEWDRNDLWPDQNFAGENPVPLLDDNSVSGGRTQQMWIGDIYGQVEADPPGTANTAGARRFRVDVGADKLRVPWGGTPPIPSACAGAGLYPTWSPSCGKCLDWTVVITFLNPAPGPGRGFLPAGAANHVNFLAWNLGVNNLLISYGGGAFHEGEWLVLNALGNGYFEADGGLLGLGINIPITVRLIVSVSGIAPNRDWKIEQRINGVQVPSAGAAAPLFTSNGDGTYSWLESLNGPLVDTTRLPQINIVESGVLVGFWPSPNYDDVRVDSWSQVPPNSCCTIAPTPDVTPWRWFVPDIQMTVQVGVVQLDTTPTPWAWFVPQPDTLVEVGTVSLAVDPTAWRWFVPDPTTIVEVGTVSLTPDVTAYRWFVPQPQTTVQVGQTELLIDSLAWRWFVPALAQLFVVTPSNLSIDPTAWRWFVPSPFLDVGDNTGKLPAGQLKFAGPVAGTIRFAGSEAGRLGS